MKVDRNDVLAALQRILGALLETPRIKARLDGQRLWRKSESSQPGYQ